MTNSAIQQLDADAQTAKRAQWESFEFTVLSDGEIEVVNESHADGEDHTYTVDVLDEVPFACTCPAFEYQSGPCKHMTAVAIREPVLEAATSTPPVRADGGTVVTDVEEEEEACPNGDPHCDGPDGDELPCFGCYQPEAR